MFLSLVRHFKCCLYFGSLWLRFALFKSPKKRSGESGCLCSMFIIWSARWRPKVGCKQQPEWRTKTPSVNKSVCSQWKGSVREGCMSALTMWHLYTNSLLNRRRFHLPSLATITPLRGQRRGAGSPADAMSYLGCAHQARSHWSTGWGIWKSLRLFCWEAAVQPSCWPESGHLQMYWRGAQF